MNSPKFDELLGSLSPEDLPDLTVRAPEAYSRARINRLVKRKLRQKPVSHRQSVFIQRHSMRTVYAVIACLVVTIGIIFAQNEQLREDFVETVAGLFNTQNPTLETTDISESTELTTTDGRFTVNRITTDTDGRKTRITLNISCEGREGELLLYEHLRLTENGRSILGLDGATPENSYNALLAGDMLAELGKDSFDMTLTVETDKLSGEELTLKIDRLWTAKFVGEKGEKLVTNPLTEDFELSFNLSDEGKEQSDAAIYRSNLTAPGGKFKLTSISVESDAKTAELTFRLAFDGGANKFLLGEGIRLTRNGRVLCEIKGYTVEQSYTAILAGDILSVIDEDGCELVLGLDAAELTGGKLRLEIDSLWVTELVGEKLTEAVSTSLGEDIVFELTLTGAAVSEARIP